ncbi:hypothetical protein [Streptomyces sp. NBC_01233]|uniref:hypothetical protein n=1 Tax=Streptomyces sp. NBC_01233 TaxID=2903787 RepID=UPI002E10DD2E|nr:hypothetical protein OG332_15950 [Streptomyces sp. NBC_01233]
MSEPQEQPPPEPRTPGTQEAPGAQAASPSKAFLEKVAYIAAPGTIVLGLLYYFGSTYTEAYYATFGVPTADLQLSVQAYLVRSPGAIFFPLWSLLFCGLALLLALGWAGRLLAGPGRKIRRGTVTAWLLAAGLFLVVAGFPVFFWEDRLPRLPGGWPREFVPCLAVALGATLAFFAVQLRLSDPDTDGRDERSGESRTADRLWLAAGALLLGVLTMSLFFGMARYVAMAGRTEAMSDAAGGYVSSPRLIVHSRVPVIHHAPGIVFNDLGSGGGPYRYQYLGFRVLAKTPARFYLVSYLPRQPERTLVVLPDDDTVRIEISP